MKAHHALSNPTFLYGLPTQNKSEAKQSALSKISILEHLNASYHEGTQEEEVTQFTADEGVTPQGLGVTNQMSDPRGKQRLSRAQRSNSRSETATQVKAIEIADVKIGNDDLEKIT